MAIEKMTRKRSRHWLRWMLIISVITLVAFLGRPTFHLLRTAWQDADKREPLPQGFIDDASRMSATQVAEVWPVPSDPDAAENRTLTSVSHSQRGSSMTRAA